MPIKSQIRLNQLTGSLDDGSAANDPTSTQKSLAAQSLQEVMDAIGAGIQKIHGASSFNLAAAGEFTHTITPAAADGAALGTASKEWSDLYLADGGQILFGTDNGAEFTLTHQATNDALRVGGDKRLEFFDADLSIHSSTDGQLDISADTTAKVIAPTIDLEASTAVIVSHDLKLDSDSAEITFGSGGDTKFIHSNANGLVLGGGEAKLGFTQTDFAEAIFSSTDGQLDLVGGSEIQLVAPIVDIDASNQVNVSNDLIVGGNLTVNGTTVTIDAANLNVEDPLIVLGRGNAADNLDMGLIFERASGNKTMIFDDNDGDVFIFGSTTADGQATGAPIDVDPSVNIPVRASQFQIIDGNDTLGVAGNDLRLHANDSNNILLESANDVIVKSKAAGGLIFKDNSNAEVGRIIHDASDHMLLSSSLKNKKVKLYGSQVLMQGYDNTVASPVALDLAEFSYSPMSQESVLEFAAARNGQIKSVAGKQLSIAAVGGTAGQAILNLGVNDNDGKAYLQLSGSGANTTINVGGASSGFHASSGVLTISGSALVLDNGASATEAQLKFKSDNANFVNLTAPGSLGGTYTLTLPPTDGTADQVLKTDGNGVLDWVAQGGAGNSVKSVRVITAATGLAANNGLSTHTGFSTVDLSAIAGADANKAIDVYVNGQLLMSGTGDYGDNIGLNTYTGGDYLLDFAVGGGKLLGAADVKFSFGLEKDDVVTIIARA